MSLNGTLFVVGDTCFVIGGIFSVVDGTCFIIGDTLSVIGDKYFALAEIWLNVGDACFEIDITLSSTTLELRCESMLQEPLPAPPFAFISKRLNTNSLSY